MTPNPIAIRSSHRLKGMWLPILVAFSVGLSIVSPIAPVEARTRVEQNSIFSIAKPIPSICAPNCVVTYIVTRTDDPTPVGCLLGNCSLREAIQAASAGSAAYTYNIVLVSGAVYGLNPGTLSVSNSVNIYLAGDPSTPQANAVIQSGFSNTIMFVLNGAMVNMSNVTIEGGSTTGYGGGIYVSSGGALALINGVVTNNIAAYSGGGIFNAGSLILLSTVVSNNQAGVSCGGVDSAQTTSITILNSSFRNNTAQVNGGGLCIAALAVSLSNVLLSENQASTGNGGGMEYYSSGSISIDHLDAYMNLAGGYGGGIANENSDMTLSDSNIGGNTARSFGGGIASIASNTSLQMFNSAVYNNSAWTDGGGVVTAYSALLTMTNVTVAHNLAGGNGGGIDSTNAWLFNVTIDGNQADADNNGSGDGGGLYIPGFNTVHMANSAVGANTDAGSLPSDCAGSGALDSLDYNLLQSSTCYLYGATAHNILNKDPRLDQLKHIGSATFTQDILPGSPLLNGGNPTGCIGPDGAVLSVDQRGFKRPVGSRCDIGAIEHQVRTFIPFSQ